MFARELYVWYRVAGAQAGPARSAVLAMQAALRSDVPGLEARLLTRIDTETSAETWMESYARPAAAGGVDEGVQATIAARAACSLAFIDGQRHCEAFEAVVR